MEFLNRHLLLSITIIGPFIGMLFSYIFPIFTRDYLCADEDFRIGNLGIAVFIQNGFAHYISNMVFAIPGALLCEHFYSTPLVLTAVAIFAFTDCMLCMPLKRATCGYSGVAYLLCSMACMYGFHWWGFVIYAILFASSLIMDHDERVDVMAHVFGFLYGAGVGVLLQFIGK